MQGAQKIMRTAAHIAIAKREVPYRLPYRTAGFQGPLLKGPWKLLGLGALTLSCYLNIISESFWYKTQYKKTIKKTSRSKFRGGASLLRPARIRHCQYSMYCVKMSLQRIFSLPFLFLQSFKASLHLKQHVHIYYQIFPIQIWPCTSSTPQNSYINKPIHSLSSSNPSPYLQLFPLIAKIHADSFRLNSSIRVPRPVNQSSTFR